MNRLFVPVSQLLLSLIERRARLLRIASLLALLAGGSAPLAVWAQQSSAEARKARSAAHGKIFADGKSLAIQGDLDGAEATLTALSSAQAKSDQWHFELALNLTRLASTIARSGDAPRARSLAARALRALNDADRVANNSNLKAGIYQQIGYLQDRFFGDKEAAKMAYRSAVQFAPDSNSAKERLERLEDTEEDTKQKAGGD